MSNYRLTAEVRERLLESYRVNPHDKAAAGWAGIGGRTLRRWRARAEAYAERVEGEGDEPLDLGARRLYARARDAWPAPAAMALLRDLAEYLDDDPDRPYYDLFAECDRVRGGMERTLIGVIYRAAVGNAAAGIAPQWKAAEFLLRTGFRERWAERIEIAEAPLDEMAALVADAEGRAEVALAEIRQKRSVSGAE